MRYVASRATAVPVLLALLCCAIVFPVQAETRPITFVVNTTFKGNFAFAHNAYHAPVQLTFNHPIVRPTTTSITLPPNQAVHLPLEADLPKDMKWTWRFGVPQTKPPAPVVVALPFKKHKGVISQGFGGVFSHNDSATFYAIDIGLKQGTPIIAAKAGVVFHVIDHYDRSGLDPSLKTQANEIRVLHADGSFATYAHIKTNSAVVTEGDSVDTGQLLAQSGNVGYTNAPHLHFVIQYNTGKGYESIPFDIVINGKSQVLSHGSTLSAPKRAWWR